MNFYNTGEKLMERFSPDPDESLLGYITRLTEANNLASSEYLYRVVQNNTPTYPSRTDLLSFANYAGCAFSDLDTIHYTRTMSDIGKGQYRFGNQILSKECFLSHYYPKVCPHCLEERQVLMMLWDLTLFCICPKHACLLIDTCTKCKKRISWKRAHVSKCSCGQDLRAIITEELSGLPLAISQYWWNILNVDIKATLPCELNKWNLAASFQNLTLDAQFRAFWLLGRLLPNSHLLGTGHGRKKLSAVESLHILNNAEILMTNWPEQLSGVLAEALEKAPPRKSPKRIAGLLGPTYRFLIEETIDLELEFIRLAFEDAFRCLGIQTKKNNKLDIFGKNPQLELSFQEK
jgi:hypothetical protein